MHICCWSVVERKCLRFVVHTRSPRSVVPSADVDVVPVADVDLLVSVIQ